MNTATNQMSETDKDIYQKIAKNAALFAFEQFDPSKGLGASIISILSYLDQQSFFERFERNFKNACAGSAFEEFLELLNKSLSKKISRN